MNRWSLRKILVWLIISIGAFALPWQQLLVSLQMPKQLAEMSSDPGEREQELRSAVRQLDRMGNVLPYGRGGIYVELAAIEADRGRHRRAAALLARGLQFEPQPLEARLALVRSTALAGGSANRALAAAYLHDVSRFAAPSDAGDIIHTAKLLGLPNPWTEYAPPAISLDRPVSILALGNIPQRTLEAITRNLEASLGATVVVTSDPGFRPVTKNRLSNGGLQYEVDALAAAIGPEYAQALDARRFAARLVIVDVDIFAFGLNFIYASVTKDGSSLISIDRFADADEGLARMRATKQALTSLLDQLAFARPSHSSCVNANSAGRVSFDDKTDVICSETLLSIFRRQPNPAGGAQAQLPQAALTVSSGPASAPGSR